MTASAVPPSSYSLPQTQNTAPVHEHNCLYTYDIRRKNAKRWQDGLLRFHTFNKRLMLYDVPRNFIGDTHWQDDGEIGDGDEVVLEKAGVLVQVCERLATNQVDLSTLWEHRKEKEKSTSRQPQSNAETISMRRRLQQGVLVPRDPNAAPRISRPVASRAVLPTKSPFEERQNRLNLAAIQRKQVADAEEPPSKRPRNDENHLPLWQVLQTSRPPQSKPAQLETPVDRPAKPRSGDAPLQSNGSVRPNSAKKLSSSKTRQGTLKVADIVDLTTISSQTDDATQEHRQNPGVPGHNSEQSRNSDRSDNIAKRAGWFSPPKPTKRVNTQVHTEGLPSNLIGAGTRPGSLATHSKHALPESTRSSKAKATISKPHGRLQQISLPNPSTPNLRRQPRPPYSPSVGTENRLPSAEKPTGGNAVATASPLGRSIATDTQKQPLETKALKVVSRPQRKTLSCLGSLASAAPIRCTTASNKEQHEPLHRAPTEATAEDCSLVSLSKGRETETCDPIRIGSSPAFETQRDQSTAVNRGSDAIEKLSEKPDEACRAPKNNKLRTTIPPHERLDAEILGANAIHHETRTTAKGHQLDSVMSPPLQSEARVSVGQNSALDNTVTTPTSKGKNEGSPPTDEPDAARKNSNASNQQATSVRPRRTRSPLKKAASIAAGQGAVDADNDGIDPSVLVHATPSDEPTRQKAHPTPKPRLMQSLRRSATVTGPSDPQLEQRQKERAQARSHSRVKDRRAAAAAAKGVQPGQSAVKEMGQPLLEREPESGPWTREAYDLFGDEMPRLRQEKTGRTVDWLERYAVTAMGGHGRDPQAEQEGSVAQLGGFESAARVMAAA